jgi:hypothetical protein
MRSIQAALAGPLGQGFHAFTAPDIGEAGVPGTAYDPLLGRLSWMQATASLGAPLKS